MNVKILYAGFGGQGLLFAGKYLAYKALLEDMQVSWLPSYGPEMRGGTANCSVIIGDQPIASPIFANPDVLVAMNNPSLDKYEDAVVPGGLILVDSSLVTRKVKRDDVTVYYVPSTEMAQAMEADGLANMILTGKLLNEHPDLSAENALAALEKVISARHADKIDLNMQAVEAGYNYKED